MKRIMILLCLISILAAYGFGQSDLSTDNVRTYADELGIPYDTLQKLIDSIAQPGSDANGNKPLSVREFARMRDYNRLEIGASYLIRARLDDRIGRLLYFSSVPPDYSFFNADSSLPVNIPDRTIVDVLIGVREDRNSRPRELFIQEIAPVR